MIKTLKETVFVGWDFQSLLYLCIAIHADILKNCFRLRLKKKRKNTLFYFICIFLLRGEKILDYSHTCSDILTLPEFCSVDARDDKQINPAFSICRISFMMAIKCIESNIKKIT